MTFIKGDPNINRNGRPEPQNTWRGLILDEGDEIIDKLARKKLVVKALFKKAEEGDVQAIKEIGDRIDGKPQQKTDITSGGKELQGLIKVE